MSWPQTYLLLLLVLFTGLIWRNEASAADLCQRSSAGQAFTYSYSGNTEPDRRALIVGVQAYEGTLKLKNAQNDAQTMANNFWQIGFGVLCLIDVDRQRLIDAMKFVSSEEGAAKSLVFYYAGHGGNIDGKDYLITASIDNTMTAEDVAVQSVPVNYVLSVLTRFKDRWTVVIIDACRNRLSVANREGRATPEEIEGYSAPQRNGSSALVIYSAREKQIANDGDEVTKAGLFVSVFSKLMMTKGKYVVELVDEAREQMKSISGADPFKFKQDADYDVVDGASHDIMFARADNDIEIAIAVIDAAVDVARKTGLCSLLREALTRNSSLTDPRVKAAYTKAEALLITTDCTDGPGSIQVGSTTNIGVVPELNSQVFWLDSPAPAVTARDQQNFQEMMNQSALIARAERLSAEGLGVNVLADGIRVRREKSTDSDVLGIAYGDKPRVAACPTGTCTPGWVALGLSKGESGFAASQFVRDASVVDTFTVDVKSLGDSLSPSRFQESAELVEKVISEKQRLKIRVVNPTTGENPRAANEALAAAIARVNSAIDLGVDPSAIDVEYAAPLLFAGTVDPYVQFDRVNPVLSQPMRPLWLEAFQKPPLTIDVPKW